MDLEPGDHQSDHLKKKESWRTVLTLAYQSLGVVYGDLSTSPLYVYRSTFGEDIQHSETNEEIYGVLSFVFWTLTLVPLLKYVFIVLRADDNGEGGTFALYSLLCRHARINSLPNCQVADEELSEYKRDGASLSPKAGFGPKLKSTLERHQVLQRLLLVLALVGACMLIGDGVLTPAISVFSAVSGLELSMSKEHHKYVEMPAACVILIGLFALQHYGTHRVGFLFAPVMTLWLLCISAIGLYNIFRWNPHIYEALSPHYMYIFLRKTQRGGWMSLGGILLCITGSEAMFADLGHFSQLSIKVFYFGDLVFSQCKLKSGDGPIGSRKLKCLFLISPSFVLMSLWIPKRYYHFPCFHKYYIEIAFTSMVYPSLILAYMGQAAYLSQHHVIKSDYEIGFYVSVPEKLRWPVLTIAVLAAVVGSQAIITGTFSIIKQCSALGCFPRVKIVHTSSKIHGQIYIPEINWILMMLCLAITIGFRDTRHMGHAAGLAVITVMLVTTCLMSLVIVLCWHQSVMVAVCFILLFGTIESLFFLASLIKFLEGAWVPIALSSVFLTVMYVWHYGTLKAYEYDIQNKVSIDWILGLGPTLGLVRVRGIGLIHTELVYGIPAIFSHFVTNLPAFHRVLIFLCIKSVPIPHVRHKERFLVGRIGSREHMIYRCIVRYGYRDVHKDDVEFERDLVRSIEEFIRSQGMGATAGNGSSPEEDGNMIVIGTCSSQPNGIQMSEDEKDLAELPSSSEQKEINSPPQARSRKKVRFIMPASPKMDPEAMGELCELTEAREAGIAYILGHYYVRAKHGSGLIRRLAIDLGYDFLMRNCRAPTRAMNVPHASSIEVSMVCRI